MDHLKNTSAEEDHRYHHYTSNDIPWYVRLIWLGFWALAIYYVVAWLMPAMQVELVSPP
jgi:hypothetical protein